MRVNQYFALLLLAFQMTAQTGGQRQGCLPLSRAASKGAAFSGAVRLQASNESTARLLIEEQLWKQRLGVSAAIYMINARNAFAEPDGNVYLGQPLIDDMVKRRGVPYAFQGGAWIVSHEYGHQFQFRMVRSRSENFTGGPVVEIQADVLGGYWVGMRLREQSNQGLPQTEVQAIRVLARQAAFDIGDFAFTNKDHHGTPAQRHAATETGLDAGYSLMFGAPETGILQFGNQMYEWSFSVAQRLFASKDSDLKGGGNTEFGVPQYCKTNAGVLGPYPNDGRVKVGDSCFGTGKDGRRYDGVAVMTSGR